MEQKIELFDESIGDKIVDGYYHNVGDSWITRKCLICGNKQELCNPSSETVKEIYICDECKEAIIYAKELRRRQVI